MAFSEKVVRLKRNEIESFLHNICYFWSNLPLGPFNTFEVFNSSRKCNLQSIQNKLAYVQVVTNCQYSSAPGKNTLKEITLGGERCLEGES